LRRVLAQYAEGRTPAQIIAGPAGRPVLHPASSLQFNLSHSGARRLAGVTRRGRLGVDLERIRPLPRFAALTRRVCTASEQTWLAGRPARLAAAGFFRLWTRKEALLKGIGVGLTVAPGLVEVLDDCVRVDGRRWLLRDLTVPRGYRCCVAVAIPRAGWSPRFRIRGWTARTRRSYAVHQGGGAIPPVTVARMLGGNAARPQQSGTASAGAPWPAPCVIGPAPCP
jgi:4'-phosphopantetheinyl transferase